MPWSDLTEVTDFLVAIPAFQNVPRPQLDWLAREGRIEQYEKSYLMKPGSVFEDFIVILEGEINFYEIQNNQRKELGLWGAGSFDAGILPFSRARVSKGYSEVLEPMTVLALHRDRFPELIAANFQLAEVLVHSMLDRVRHFTSMHFQSEKLIALGKLSAGLTHELNNPSAAMLRSADLLEKQEAESLEDYVRDQISLEEYQAIRPMLDKSYPSTHALSAIDRLESEEAVQDWLDEHHCVAECSQMFVEFGISSESLDRVAAQIAPARLDIVLTWLSKKLDRRKATHEIMISAQRISELVRSVKSYTRMDQAQDMRELSINDGIRNTLTMLDHKIRRNGVVLHVDLNDALPAIMGLPGELTQVWTNIIDNAIDAMKSGGDLHVTTTVQHDHIVFSVMDSGTGIPPEHIERIFDPFFTTKDVGEGTGVGLDVVQKVVQLHKGTIKVDSKPGRTEFRVSFPRKGT